MAGYRALERKLAAQVGDLVAPCRSGGRHPPRSMQDAGQHPVLVCNSCLDFVAETPSRFSHETTMCREVS